MSAITEKPDKRERDLEKKCQLMLCVNLSRIQLEKSARMLQTSAFINEMDRKKTDEACLWANK